MGTSLRVRLERHHPSRPDLDLNTFPEEVRYVDGQVHLPVLGRDNLDLATSPHFGYVRILR
jgi:hypothetical protein